MASFNPERVVCYGCGCVGHTQQTCPTCASEKGCRYCKEKGHPITTCPKLKPCNHCQIKGHKLQHCPSLPRLQRSRTSNFPPPLRTTTTPSAINNTQRKGPPLLSRLPSRTIDKREHVSISVTPPSHNDDVWRALDLEMRNVCNRVKYGKFLLFLIPIL